MQELAKELGSFARVTTLQSDSENLVSVIQAAYNVRFDLCMTSEFRIPCVIATHVHLEKMLSTKYRFGLCCPDLFTVHNKLSVGLESITRYLV